MEVLNPSESSAKSSGASVSNGSVTFHVRFDLSVFGIATESLLGVVRIFGGTVEQGIYGISPTVKYGDFLVQIGSLGCGSD